MNEPRVFARQSNMTAGHDHPSGARSAGREGLEQPGRVLYVYDRVSTKKAMHRRMENITLTEQGADLSGIYKKKAHIHTDADRNLKDFYRSRKQSGARTIHMGKVEDKSVHMPPAGNIRTSAVNSNYEHTQSFQTLRTSSGSRRNGQEQQRYTAFQNQPDDGQTRMFNTPQADPGTGGAAVKPRRKILLEGIINLFESIEERWQKDVDTAKKQALLHKKWQEHRRGLTLALVILLIFAVCCTAMYELIFVVRSVEAEGSALYTTDEIISAAGIGEKDNLYDFRADDVTSRITFYCPYIKSAELTRKLPTTVSLVLEDDSALYCANIFGEIVALSPGLRVLGTLSTEEAADYILLRLPGITEAVAGRTIVFADARHERYIRQVLEEVTDSALNGRVSFMDLRDEHDLILYCDGMYELQLGNTTDLKMKLRMADTAIGDVMFPQNTPARVDLSVVSEASVRADLRLDLTVIP